MALENAPRINPMPDVAGLRFILPRLPALPENITTLQFMLLQSAGRKLYVLPAWPKNWDVSFKLHAPYSTTVEGIYKAGKLEKLTVTPESRLKDVI